MRTSRVLTIISFGLGIGVLVVIAIRAGAGLREVFFLLPPRSHVLALGALATALASRAGLWVLLARGVGVRLTFRSAFLAQVAGEGAGAVTPARVAHDPMRVAVASRDSGNVGGIAAVLVGEWLAKALTLVGVGILLLLFLGEPRLPAYGTLAYAGFTLATAVAAMLLARTPFRHVPPRWWRWLRLGERRWRGARLQAHRLRRRLVRLRRLGVRLVLTVILVTLVHVGARLAVAPALAVGAGVEVELAPLLLWPLFLLYAGTLIPLPAGGGGVEIGFAVTLARSVPVEALPAMTLWWRFYTLYLAALAGGLVLTAGARALSTRRAQRL